MLFIPFILYTREMGHVSSSEGEDGTDKVVDALTGVAEVRVATEEVHVVGVDFTVLRT